MSEKSELEKIMDRLNATPDPDLVQQPWPDAPEPGDWRNADGTKMNWLQRSREHTSSFIYHAGWACVGQECDCGHNPFNGLAKRVDPWMNGADNWVETDGAFAPRGVLRKALYAVGSALMKLGAWVDNLGGNTLPPPPDEIFVDPSGLDGKAEIDTLIKNFVPQINCVDFSMTDEELAIEAAAIDREIQAIIDAQNVTSKVRKEGE